jgi:hypothetical protein
MYPPLAIFSERSCFFMKHQGRWDKERWESISQKEVSASPVTWIFCAEGTMLCGLCKASLESESLACLKEPVNAWKP